MSTFVNSKGQTIHVARLLFFLDEFNNDGLPANLNFDPNGSANNTDLFKTLDASFLSDINSKLPESQRLQNTHPDWIKPSDLHIIEDNATIDITFVDEGAGYRNSLGYYIYDSASPPRSLDNIGSLYVIFPNASKTGGGGSLNAGDTVRLASEFSYSTVNGKQIATPTNYNFSNGQSIGFVLFANAWRSYKNNINRKGFKYYSEPRFNPESTSQNRQHTVNIRSDYLTDHIIIGFEDLNRDGNSDDDFNDCTILAKVTPTTALDDDNINDTSKNTAKGTILCDDQIIEQPHINNDYSDDIVEYDMEQTLVNGFVTEMNMIFHLKHRSAFYDHEFGLEIANLGSFDTTITKETFLGNTLTSSVESITVGSDDKLNVFYSTKTLLPASGNSGHYANTAPGWEVGNLRTPVTSVKIKIVFNEDVADNAFNNEAMPYMPYLDVYKSGDYTQGNFYTLKYKSIYFGRERTEITDTRIPKILVLPDVLNYQCGHERHPMINVYPEFKEYLRSGGNRNTNWTEVKREQYLNPLMETPTRNFTI